MAFRLNGRAEAAWASRLGLPSNDKTHQQPFLSLDGASQLAVSSAMSKKFQALFITLSLGICATILDSPKR